MGERVPGFYSFRELEFPRMASPCSQLWASGGHLPLPTGTAEDVSQVLPQASMNSFQYQIVYRHITLTLLNTVGALLPRPTWKRLQIPNPRFIKLGDEMRNKHSTKLGDEMRGKHKGVERV
ncbi:hypothetical protein DKX38_017657 [Salix brachista]|uniref:Uncharacterized protein n=1 Tax=Salix brachista TaxID=2182728 RepID=A0A5N5KWS0_9ROSI|nr:hypothetical protein DKX38_017657 [Salix brachista]